MSHWLSFWNKDTRRLNGPLLQGDAVSAIYIPYGKQRVSRGDIIYCVGIENGDLRLITRLHAASLNDDLDHRESVWVDYVEGEAVDADFQRVMPSAVVTAILYLHVDGSEHRVRLGRGGRVLPHAFQGRSSIRELASGFQALDALL